MPINMNPSHEQLMELWSVVMTQITKLRIDFPETICQTDRVVIGSYQFIEDCCDVVGYYEEPEDTDE